jgi:L-asparaginase/Glu-tRNA(Gln) amidotransferase subunit D
MVPSDSGGIAPKLGAVELVASVPVLAEVAEIEARSPLRLPSLSLTPADLVEVARLVEEGFVAGEKPVVVTGAAAVAMSTLNRPRTDDAVALIVPTALPDNPGHGPNGRPKRYQATRSTAQTRNRIAT